MATEDQLEDPYNIKGEKNEGPYVGGSISVGFHVELLSALEHHGTRDQCLGLGFNCQYPYPLVEMASIYIKP